LAYTIEDFIERLDHLVSAFYFGAAQQPKVHASEVVSMWDKKFVSDVSMHTCSGSSLSTAQADVAMKILKKYPSVFNAQENAAIDIAIRDRSFRKPLHQTVQAPREVRWAGGSVLLFRFSYNAPLIAALKSVTYELPEITPPETLHRYKCWRIVVDQLNHKELMEIISKYGFGFDDAVLHLFMEISNNENKRGNVKVSEDTFDVEINNDVLASLWLTDMEWLRNV